MTQDEYELSKKRLEDQRRAGVELVENAYEAQVRALDLIWMLQGGRGTVAIPGVAAAPAPVPQAPPAPGERPRRRSFAEVDADVRAALPRLPERFTRGDVCQILGYEPERGALYRVLKKLAEDDLTAVELHGNGQSATVYRKTGGAHSPPSA